MEPILICALAVVIYGGLVTLRDLTRDLGGEGIRVSSILAGYGKRLRTKVVHAGQDFLGWLAPPRQLVSYRYARTTAPLSYSSAVQHAAQQRIRMR
ncbi:hypothetical protein GMST_08000 [Geomonas silvestris]|uniref:Uncharacterized protein n=1 Tax=Geomonas silvestris TaxID=2740184 RepID=A0A6V8MEP2_9BACT|nr:hypothetical protein GMST_08000 [Geomonas silvestris]